jgi:TonB family protein
MDKSRTIDKSRREGGRGSRFITTGERIGGYIGWAFILALTLHTVLVPFARSPGQPAANPQQPYKTTVETLATPPPRTPPPPTPTPPPQRAVQPREKPAQQSAKAHVLKTHNIIGRAEPPVQTTTAPETNVGPPVESSPPQPAATIATCPDPDREAHTLSLATPVYPPVAQEENAGERQVQVAVTISPAGAVVAESIVQTSGIAEIDRDALRVARETTYEPQIEDCRPVLGTYKYVIDYQSD